MTYLFLSLIILAGLCGLVFMVRAVAKDLRAMEDEDAKRNEEKWRGGK